MLIIHYSLKPNRLFINKLIINLLAMEPIFTISVHLTVIVGSLNFFVSFARLDGIAALTCMFHTIAIKLCMTQHNGWS